MGTWSAGSFGNDTAVDFSYELEGQKRWTRVQAALDAAISDSADSDVAAVGIAAAEVVAHGLGRPTQSDVYTEQVEAFVRRARKPNGRLVARAVRALDAATDESGELAELWSEDPNEWADAVALLRRNLTTG